MHVNNKSEVVGIYVLSTSNRNLYNNIEGVVVVIMLAMLHGCGCLIIIIGRGILTRDHLLCDGLRERPMRPHKPHTIGLILLTPHIFLMQRGRYYNTTNTYYRMYLVP